MNNYELIRHIKERRPLWDRMYWDKIDAKARETMWEEISEIMGYSKRIIKTRWKNLRDSYRKIIKNMDDYESQDAKWSYFGAMEFMKDITLRATPRNADISKTEIISIEPDYTLTLESNSNQEESLYSEQNHLKKDCGLKRRASEDLVSQFLDIHPQEKRLESEDHSQMKQETDEDYQFLLSLYPHFRQVPTLKKLPLRMKIEQLIYEEICAAQSYKVGSSCGCSSNN